MFVFSFHLVDQAHADLTIFDVDYAYVLLRKTDMIRKSPELNAMLQSSGNVLGKNYGFDNQMLKFVAADLQQSTVVELLVAAGLRPSQPTLIISECVLVCK